ncbi:rCG21157 [Rattus norvegicus]|uniref:RCG21157 n=1 Tax=Rattus norvegicus TaxID=10116 RepID=A6J1U4_RAT|nr:rCG21157 [Rattus norvegicus]
MESYRNSSASSSFWGFGAVAGTCSISASPSRQRRWTRPGFAENRLTRER